MSPKRIIPFAKITIPFVLGIIVQKHTSYSSSPLNYWCLISFALFLTSYLIINESILKRIGLSFLAYTFLFCSGSFILQDHASSHKDELPKESNYLFGEIISHKKNTDSSSTFVFQVQSYKHKGIWSNALHNEKVLVRLRKSTPNYHLPAFNKVLLKGNLATIRPPTHPDAVNFKEIYASQNIFNFFYTNQQSCLHPETSSKANFLVSYKQEFTAYILNYFEIKTASFIIALIANEKEHISSDLKTKISKNGISHLLAISGLHIGIIYSLLFLISKNFRRKSYPHTIFTSIAICSLLIAYGTFCNFSPSISRSVITFCILETSLIFKRNNNPINSLFVSAFIILVLYPNDLFQIGFQLSYAGVLSILLLYPQINSWLPTKYKILKLCWSAFSVSFAAQIGVLPILLYYFNTFSINGIFLSILLTPLIGLTVYLSLAQLLFFKIPVLHHLPQLFLKPLTKLFSIALDTSQNTLFTIQYSKGNLLQLVLYYSVIFALFDFFKRFNTRSIYIILYSLIGYFSSTFVINLYNNRQTDYHLFRDNHLKIRSQTGQIVNDMDLNNFCREQKNILPNTTINGNKIYSINQHLFLWQKSHSIARKLNIEVMLVSKKIPLTIISQAAPSTLILDSNLDNKYTKTTKTFCRENNIHFHSLKHDGIYHFGLLH